MSPTEPLTFRVAPHLMQDLGLNLYTSLSRVLVEFAANAHDADAEDVKITLDFGAIEKAREAVRLQYKAERAASRAAAATTEGGLGSGEAASAVAESILPLDERQLPDQFQVIIEDTGFGMSREDLRDKFLIAGRRRRVEEAGSNGRTPKGRLVMGKKGVGKLAGFGAARRVRIITRKAGEAHATSIVLDYEQLARQRHVSDHEIPDETFEDGAGLPETGGTRVILDRLSFDAMKNGREKVEGDIGDHFSQIDPKDFVIILNGAPIKPVVRELAYAYPEPDSKSLHDFVEKTLTADGEDTFTFNYRIRFTEKPLTAQRRGLRVYARRRIAAAPTLLDLNTGMHGFRNTEYLDGVVHADFIDEAAGTDYIATDRHSLRWDVSRLQCLRDFLTEEMKEACISYQHFKDAADDKAVDKDAFTSKLINRTKLSKRKVKVAKRIAKLLAGSYPNGVENLEYQRQLEIFMSGLDQGDVMGALGKIAQQRHPKLDEIVEQVSRLTEREIADAVQYVEGRLMAISALGKLYEKTDFKKAKNERELHDLFEKNPWLINASFSSFIASDISEREVMNKLKKQLEVGPYTPANYDPTTPEEIGEYQQNKRPDLVFTVGSPRNRRVVIVELKALNTPLQEAHLTQLEGYMRRAEEFLRSRGGEAAHTRVEGMLIGSMPDPASKAEGALGLKYKKEKHEHTAHWQIYDISEILASTRDVHKEIWENRDILLEIENEPPTPSEPSQIQSPALPLKLPSESTTPTASPTTITPMPVSTHRPNGPARRGRKRRKR